MENIKVSAVPASPLVYRLHSLEVPQDKTSFMVFIISLYTVHIPYSVMHELINVKEICFFLMFVIYL